MERVLSGKSYDISCYSVIINLKMNISNIYKPSFVLKSSKIISYIQFEILWMEEIMHQLIASLSHSL